ncbi:hypothetical protein COO60DRAFT_1660326 [Scenedesmus sp. NREL 46B-D3]|nr:hypothetical protein COO60DRAFT_1660326 [Scenedesmus sp. NREL 46B-D3]
MDYSRDNYEPGVVAADGAPEVTAVFDPTNGEYSVKRMRLTPFCTGNSHLADGRVLAAGGDDFAGDRLSPGYTDGLRGLRLYQKPTPGTWDEGGWKTLNNQLGEPRWYPTQALMPDGVRTLVVGGTRSQNTSTPVPSTEIYSSATLGIVSLATLGVLERFIGFTLYPLVYSLPYLSLGSSGTTQVFMFNCDRGAVLNLAPNNTWSEYRDIPSALWPTPGFCGAMSMAGTATMLMLEPEAGYAAEVVMFGGFQRGRPECECDQPTNSFAHRIRLDQESVDANELEWQREAMPYGRNMNDCVLLPNGQIIIVNGAKTGVISNARDPAHDAWLYNPKAPAGSRFTTLAATNIDRYYHSTALLLPDASILVMGSEYGTCSRSCADRTPWEFQHRAERFLPPYFFGTSRPDIELMSATELRYGASLDVTYTGNVTGAVLMTPAAVTHQNNMNQRAIRLVVVSNSGGAVVLRMPPSQYITAPGWHMLFLMNGDVPCLQASWLWLRYFTGETGQYQPLLPAPYDPATGACLKQRETMPYGRNMNDAVMLPNGQIIIVNGARTGVISNARDPAHDAWLYDPKAPAGQRFRTLAATNINRYYHSTALLLPDASILVAGCEYGTCTASCARPTAWRFQHQAERFLPPYFFQSGRPVVTSISATSARYGATLTAGYTGRVNMNQRAIRLVVVSNSGGAVVLRMPPSQYITAPGWHMCS